MINLLPEQNKKVIKKILLFRFIIVSSVFLLLISVLFNILLVPSYIFVSNRWVQANNQFNKVNKSEGFVIDKTIKSVVDDLSRKIFIFPDDINNSPPPPDVFIKTLVSIQVPGITISGISFDDKTGTGINVPVEIKGHSNSRNTLYSFSEKLESADHFSGVVVPVSSFVKGKDTDFVITFNFSM